MQNNLWPMNAALLAAVALLGGCQTLRFVYQAGLGHIAILGAAQPIGEVIAAPQTPPKLRALLGRIEEVKAFGVAHGLTASDNYRSFVQLDGEAAVWAVVACKPLAFEPLLWSFPVVGSMPYLGWFDRLEAERFAAGLRRQGWDVAVRPVAAYSTLGWSNDPLLSTMLARGPDVVGSLINTVLHESAHATIYVADQSVFNESVATFIGDRLTGAYLDAHFGRRSGERAAYLYVEELWRERRQQMLAAFDALRALYAGDLPDDAKLTKKAEILAALTAAIGAHRPINNATLVDLRLYRAGETELDTLLGACRGDWPKFLTALRTVKSSDFETPHEESLGAVLSKLAGRCDP